MKSLKKSLLTVLCGSLLLGAAPVKAEWRFRDLSGLGKAFAATCFVGACYSVYKFSSWLLGAPTSVVSKVKSKPEAVCVNSREEAHKIAHLRVGCEVKIENDIENEFSSRRNSTLPKGTYTVKSQDSSRIIPVYVVLIKDGKEYKLTFGKSNELVGVDAVSLKINSKDEFNNVVNLEKGDTFILKNTLILTFAIAGDVMLTFGDFTVTEKTYENAQIHVQFRRLHLVQKDPAGQTWSATFKNNKLVAVKFVGRTA